MAELLSTVVMKTDLRAYTARVRTLTDENLRGLLQDQVRLVQPWTQVHGGRIVKGAGDSFWLTFPSVTAAARAAIAMQRELRLAQLGQPDAQRLAIRIVITLGDVLHDNADIFGDAVNLAARIEGITPADEIYLSLGAWAAINGEEFATAYVQDYTLKGFESPVPVYKIVFEHQTRILRDVVVVLTDLRNFYRFLPTVPVPAIEQALTHLAQLHGQVCGEEGGTIRMLGGDQFILTFETPAAALAAAARLGRAWEAFRREVDCPWALSIGAEQGDVCLFRTFLYGQVLLAANKLASATCQLGDDSAVLVSARVAETVAGTDWAGRLRPLPFPASPDPDRPAYQLPLADP